MGNRQLGFGWGRGRRVITTQIAGAALTRALARPPQGGDRHGLDEPNAHTGHELLDALEQAPGARRRPLKLRMAKADTR
jgi:hypothetical protein